MRNFSHEEQEVQVDFNSIKGPRKVDKKLLQLKQMAMLEVDDGSLRSNDMYRGSNASTVKININQSEMSPRSFYTENAKTKSFNQSLNGRVPRNANPNNIEQIIETSELKNEQKVMALEFYKKRVAVLENALSNTKVFLYMVV